MAHVLPPECIPPGHSGPQQHWATVDATKIAKAAAKIMNIFIVIGSF